MFEKHDENKRALGLRFKHVAWAEENYRRWVFSLSNAGSRYFEDRSDLSRLNEINWNAVGARTWKSCKEEKQAEFLVEERLPWSLIERVGVFSSAVYQSVVNSLSNYQPSPCVEIKRDWYY